MSDDFELVGDSCIGADDSDAEAINTPAETEVEEAQKLQFNVPEWFRDPNVKPPSTLKDSSLEIVDKKDLRVDKTSSEKKSDPQNAEEQNNSAENARPQISRDRFQVLCDTIAGTLNTGVNTDCSVALYGKAQADEAFFTLVVEHVAGQLGADILSITYEDLIDLAGLWLSVEPKEEKNDRQGNTSSDFGLVQRYFATQSAKRVSDESKERNRQAVAAVLGVLHPEVRNEPNESEATEGPTGSKTTTGSTIIHILNSNKILESNGREGYRVLSRLREAMEERRKAGHQIMLLVSCFAEDSPYRCYRAGVHDFCECTDCARILKKLRMNTSAVVKIAPSDYYAKGCSGSGSLAKSNVRRLARNVCRKIQDEKSKAILESLCQPEVLEAHKGLRVLGSPDWTSDDMQRAARQICGRAHGKKALEIEDIVAVVERVRAPKTDREAEDLKGLTVKERIAAIEDDCNEHETRLLEKIVDPEDLVYSYDDVIMDEETKSTVRQLIALASMNIKGSSRLLEQIKMKGMLFYGPPGTGKTHLVRAIAKESNAAMLALDPSAINNKWCGESEKLIAAAFTLAAKLQPCLIFIDEVDALFYRRSSEDKSWQRSQLTQFLQNMDGIGTKKNAPIVITATNRPKDLDDAFLRRLPQKVMFKLPDESARSKILRLFLKAEDLDPEVDIDLLAKTTEGFSGSDLKNFCAQAALTWAVETSEAGLGAADEVQLLLKNSHFERAKMRTQSTVSTGSLEDISSFAKRFGAVSTAGTKPVPKVGQSNWSQKMARLGGPPES